MNKTIAEVAKEFNEAFKTEREKSLEKHIEELEKVVNNLSEQVNYLMRGK